MAFVAKKKGKACFARILYITYLLFIVASRSSGWSFVKRHILFVFLAEYVFFEPSKMS